jgi:WD40 repeat protein
LSNVQIFLSTVTAEFRSYRDSLRHYLDRHNVTIKVQEDFITTGTETLDMLDLYIKQCDAVIHLVGDMTGAMAQSPSVDAIRRRYPDVDKRFPVLTEFLKPDGPPLPYTQWEAWLALYHKKTLIICVPTQGAARDERYRDDEVERAAQQAHLKRLETIERYPGIRFTSSDKLAIEVLRSSLQEILNSADPVQSSGARMIDFAQELMRHGEIIGREQEIATVRGWIEGASNGYILIKGNPGTGKSALMVAILKQLENEYGYESVPYHFLRRRQGDWGEPDAVVSNLIARLEQINRSPERLASHGMDRLFVLLKAVGQQYAAFKRRLVVIVDGLDEASVADGTEGVLSRFLPATVPDNVFILCASRPNDPELGWLEERLGLFTIDLDQRVDNNRAVVAAYWHKLGSQLNPPLDEKLVQSAIAAAEGNMLHAVTLCEAFKSNTQVRDPKRIPGQFNRLLEDLWRRLVQMKDREISGRVIAGLGLLTVAYEALPLSTLAPLLDWRHPADIEDFKRYARPFLLEESADWHGGEARYRPFHESIREFLTAGDHMLPQVNRDHHKLLAERLANWPPADGAGKLERGYAARFALVHLSAIADWTRVGDLLGDLQYCVAAVETAGPQLLLARITAFDLQGKPPPLVERANALRRVLRKGSEVLESYPGELPNLMHNDLTCLGWSRERIRATFSGFSRGWGLINAIVRGDEICTLHGHKNIVMSCDIDSQGRYGVSGGWDGQVIIWDLDRGVSLHVLRYTDPGHCEIDSCAISPDGRYVIAALSLSEEEPSRDYGRIRIWRTRDGALIVDAEHDRPLSTRVAFAGNEKAIACHQAGYIDVYDITRSTSKRLMLGEKMKGHVAVNASGTLLAGITAQGCVVWRLHDGSRVSGVSLSLFGDWSYRHAPTCSFGPDETSVAVAGFNRALVFNSADGSVRYCSSQLDQPTDQSSACRLLDNKRVLFTSASSCELVIWDMETNRAVARYEGHTSSVNWCAATPDGRLALSGGGDNTVRLWSLVGQASATHADRHSKTVYDCTVDGTATHACSVAEGDLLTIWNARTGARPLPINTPVTSRSVRFCGFQGHSRLAMLGWKLRLFDPETAMLKWEKDIPRRNDGRFLSWVDDGVGEGVRDSIDRLDQLPLLKTETDVIVWRSNGEFESVPLSARNAAVSQLNGGRTIAALQNTVVEIINLDGGDRKTIAEGVKTCVGSPRNNALYALMANQQLVRLDATSGKVLDVLGEIPQETVRLLIDPQETSLWALCADATFEWFSAKTYEVLMAFSPQTSCLVQQTSIPSHDIRDFCFLSGMLITAGWSDATLRVWDAYQPMPLAVIPGASPFRCVDAARDRIVAGDEKGNVWFLAPMTELYP